MGHAPGLCCILSKCMLCCKWYYQYPGRRSPQSFWGVNTSFAPSLYKGGDHMVTWPDLIEFCTFLVVLISLILGIVDHKNKK